MGKEHQEAPNCIVMQSPSALTQLGIAISKVCNTNKFGFLVFDSLSTLLVYNNEQTAIKFVHNLTNQLRKNQLAGVILSSEKDLDKKLMGSLAQFCDKVVNV